MVVRLHTLGNGLRPQPRSLLPVVVDDKNLVRGAIGREWMAIRDMDVAAAVIGIPVGFVGAAESKEALALDGRVPYLVVRGRRGGSAMAAAAVNALASEAE